MPNVVNDVGAAPRHHIPPCTPAGVDSRGRLAAEMARPLGVFTNALAWAPFGFVVCMWSQVLLDLAPSLILNCFDKNFVLWAPFGNSVGSWQFVIVTEFRVVMDGSLGRAPNVGCNVVDGGPVPEDRSASKPWKCWCSELAEKRNIRRWFMEVFVGDCPVVDDAARCGKILFVSKTYNVSDRDEIQTFTKSTTCGEESGQSELYPGDMVKSRFVIKRAQLPMNRPFELIEEPMQRAPPKCVENNLAVVSLASYADGALWYTLGSVELRLVVLHLLVFVEWVAFCMVLKQVFCDFLLILECKFLE